MMNCLVKKTVWLTDNNNWYWLTLRKHGIVSKTNVPNSCETTSGTVYCPNLSLTTFNTKLSRFFRGILFRKLHSGMVYIFHFKYFGLCTPNAKKINKAMKRSDQNSSHLLRHEFGTKTEINWWTFWPDSLKRGNKMDGSSLHPVMK